MKNRTIFLICAGLIWLGIVAFREASPKVGRVELSIVPTFEGQPLVIKKQCYRVGSRDSIWFDLLKFYVSAVHLVGKNEVYIEKKSFHLIDAEEETSQTIVLEGVPAVQYDSLFFYIGIDSLTNAAAPVLEGDLEPFHGMYWDWGSGYVNFKIEGRSLVRKTTRHAFEFHIGGFTAPFATARRVGFPLAATRPTGAEKISIEVDMGHFFSNIDLTSHKNIMTPSADAVQMADQFERVFKIKVN